MMLPPAHLLYPNAEKRSIENPAVPLSSAAAYEMFAEATPAARVHVNERTAMTYAAVWRAVNLIASDVAKLPIEILRREGEGWTQAREHPVYDLLRVRPSPHANPFTFRQVNQSRTLLWGNAFAFIQRERGTTPRALVTIHPRECRPDWDDGIDDLVYRVGKKGSPETVRPEDMLHIRGLGDEILGWSIVRHARESIGVGIASARYAGAFFGNGARPSTVLRHPGKLKPEAAKNLRDSFERLYSGVDNAYRTAVLEEGIELANLSMTNADAEFLATRKFELTEIANWFGVPPHKLGDSTRAGYNSLEMEQQAYLDESLEPWLCIWESELEAKLLAEAERETHRIRFNRKALLRANSKDRALYYEKAIKAGWMSRDEVRAKEDLNPIPDGSGKVFLTPSDTQTIDEREADAADDANQDDARRAITHALEDAACRMARRIHRQAERRARNPDRWGSWATEEMPDRNLRVVEDAIEPALALARSFGFSARTAGEGARDLLRSLSELLLERSECQADELPGRVQGALEELEERAKAALFAPVAERI